MSPKQLLRNEEFILKEKIIVAASVFRDFSAVMKGSLRKKGLDAQCPVHAYRGAQGCCGAEGRRGDS